MSRLYFSIYSPTPETTEFRVANRSPRRTLFTTASSWAGALSRIAVCAFVLLSLYVHWLTGSKPAGDGTEAVFLADPFEYLGLGALAHPAVTSSLRWLFIDRLRIQTVGWTVHAAVSACAIWLATQRPYIEESLLVLRGTGVQTTTSSSNYLVSPTVRFIPTSAIQDILLPEAFKGFEVRYYLCIVEKDKPNVVVVFPKLLPRLPILREVWRQTRAGTEMGLIRKPNSASSPTETDDSRAPHALAQLKPITNQDRLSPDTVYRQSPKQGTENIKAS